MPPSHSFCPLEVRNHITWHDLFLAPGSPKKHLEEGVTAKGRLNEYKLAMPATPWECSRYASVAKTQCPQALGKGTTERILQSIKGGLVLYDPPPPRTNLSHILLRKAVRSSDVKEVILNASSDSSSETVKQR